MRWFVLRLISRFDSVRRSVNRIVSPKKSTGLTHYYCGIMEEVCASHVHVYMRITVSTRA